MRKRNDSGLELILSYLFTFLNNWKRNTLIIEWINFVGKVGMFRLIIS